MISLGMGRQSSIENIQHELMLIKQSTEENGTTEDAKSLFAEYAKFIHGEALSLEKFYVMFGLI